MTLNPERDSVVDLAATMDRLKKKLHESGDNYIDIHRRLEA